MKDRMFKKYQSNFNKVIRNVNHSLENDPLFLGRFVIRQIKWGWERFDDNSGGVLFVTLRVLDKETKYYKDYFLDYAPYFKTIYWKINMEILNKFIVNDSNYWKEEPRHTQENAKDYRKIKVNEELWDYHKYKLNYYLDYKDFKIPF